MRKTVSIILLLLANFGFIFAQTTMNIHMKDGKLTQIPLSQIDKVTYSGEVMPSAGNTVTDIDGNVYPTVKIGNQVWMAADLKTTKYRGGQLIPVPGTNRDAWGSNKSGALAWYENDEYVYKPTYGALYNWYAVSNSSGLCPAGWHVPSNQEFKILQEFLGGWREAGKKLKSQKAGAGVHPRWTGENSAGSNESGFDGLPSGHRHFGGSFGNIGLVATYWTSTQATNENEAFNWVLSNSTGQFNGGWTSKNSAFAVRCVKD